MRDSIKFKKEVVRGLGEIEPEPHPQPPSGAQLSNELGLGQEALQDGSDICRHGIVRKSQNHDAVVVTWRIATNISEIEIPSDQRSLSGTGRRS